MVEFYYLRIEEEKGKNFFTFQTFFPSKKIFLFFKDI